MKTIKSLQSCQLFIAAMAAVALSGAMSGAAIAHDEEKSKSGFSWNLNIGLGNFISYGHNRTKGSGVIKEEARTVANFSRLVLALPATVTLTRAPPSRSLSQPTKICCHYLLNAC